MVARQGFDSPHLHHFFEGNSMDLKLGSEVISVDISKIVEMSKEEQDKVLRALALDSLSRAEKNCPSKNETE
jgi:hypothetical protein